VPALAAAVFAVNVTPIPPVPALPDVAEGLSQFGYAASSQNTMPLAAVTVYVTEFGENGPPWKPVVENEVPGATVIAVGEGDPVAHVPPTHMCPDGHTVPQAPQFCASL